ncbi:hypothetical protein [Chenggangzhangella methanolivorans]|uniref:hypothetical protein n=1 Tax=Chenggangzhangella methanolivorans TaxID=1437009 RepID=UPI0036700033
MQNRQYRFQVGDEVRLVVGTTLWGGHPELHDLTGRVAAHVDDGTSMNRIDVEFGGERVFRGISEGQFEPA